MRFNKHKETPIPAVNLIPMLNVMLGILAFFVLITMTLTSPTGLELQLPARSDSTPPPDAEDDDAPPLVITLGDSNQILLEEEPISVSEAETQIRQHLAGSEERIVYVKAAPQASYQEVVEFVFQMKEVGGDRVSLALEEE
ncbi:MAG: ExbD/TolR family protein [Elainellaceae cyanobacterium]